MSLRDNGVHLRLGKLQASFPVDPAIFFSLYWSKEDESTRVSSGKEKRIDRENNEDQDNILQHVWPYVQDG